MRVLTPAPETVGADGFAPAFRQQGRDENVLREQARETVPTFRRAFSESPATHRYCRP